MERYSKRKILVYVFSAVIINLVCSAIAPVYAGGYIVTDKLWLKAIINTEDKGRIDGVWHKGGEDITARGDRVIWGYFYADPSVMDWGSENNPDLFVKIWFDVSGALFITYFHVSVPEIDVYSDYPYDGQADQQSTATMFRRFVEHDYRADGFGSAKEQYEDGDPAPGYYPAGNPAGSITRNNLRIGAVVNTEGKGFLEAVWQEGGSDITARGDQVVWGYFYADPSIVSWGSPNNPDLFVKIWFDVGGKAYVDFFHVSVPDIEIYSELPTDGSYDNKGTTIMADRFIEHEYSWSATYDPGYDPEPNEGDCGRKIFYWQHGTKASQNQQGVWICGFRIPISDITDEFDFTVLPNGQWQGISDVTSDGISDYVKDNFVNAGIENIGGQDYIVWGNENGNQCFQINDQNCGCENETDCIFQSNCYYGAIAIQPKDSATSASFSVTSTYWWKTYENEPVQTATGSTISYSYSEDCFQQVPECTAFSVIPQNTVTIGVPVPVNFKLEGNNATTGRIDIFNPDGSQSVINPPLPYNHTTNATFTQVGTYTFAASVRDEDDNAAPCTQTIPVTVSDSLF